MVSFINWDIRGTRCVHFESTCGMCGSREAAVGNVYAALIEGHIFPKASCTVPAKSRFGSYMKAAAEQAPMLMFSGLGKLTFDKVFPQYNDGVAHEVEEEGEENDRQYIRNKVWRTRMAMGDMARVVTVSTLVFVMVPLDWLWARLQKLDDQCLLPDLVGEHSPVSLTMRRLLAMLTGEDTELLTLWAHFQGSAVSYRRAQEVAFLAILAGYALLWWRFDQEFSQWPFQLVKLLGPDAPKVAGRFFATPRCCLDRNFSCKVRARFASADAMLQCSDFVEGVRLWARTSHVTNMHIERLLALIKRAAGGRKPWPLERYMADGLLTQFISSHLAAGGRDPRVWTRSNLTDEGVVVEAEALRDRKAQETRGGIPPWMAYAAARKHTRSSGCAYKEWLKGAAIEFKALPAEEQRVFKDIAQASRRKRRTACDAASVGAPDHSAQPSSHLWGLPSCDSPLKPEVFLAAARSQSRRVASGDPASDDNLNFHDWGKTCKGAFQNGAFVADRGLVIMLMCRASLACHVAYRKCTIASPPARVRH